MSHIPDRQAVICCIQCFGLTILSRANTETVSLSSEAGLLLTAARGSKPLHWAGDLSGWMTSDRRNVLSGCPQQGYQSDVDRAWGGGLCASGNFVPNNNTLQRKRRTKLELLHVAASCPSASFFILPHAVSPAFVAKRHKASKYVFALISCEFSTASESRPVSQL